MGDSSTYLFPVALKWDLGPERLKKVKNKLLLHFQSKKKSGGGECELRDLDCSQGHVLIYFKEESVRDQVLQKQTHELQLPKGETLRLVVMSPEEINPKENRKRQKVAASSSSRHSLQNTEESSDEEAGETHEPLTNEVVLENIQESCTSEMLNLLLENITNLSEDKDFNVEMIPEFCLAVVTFTCPIDILGFIQTFSSNTRVRHLKLRAQPLEKTQSIRVENLPPNTLEDHVIIYFESPKHGGGRVQKAEMVPEEDAAVVTFCEREVVEAVLVKQHVFGKEPISVYPFHSSLGVTLYGKKRPSVKLPKPLEFPMSPQLLEFIFQDSQIKHNISSEMAKLYCDITWPEPDCQNPVIKLSISKNKSTHLRTMAKIVHSWQDQIFSQFSRFVSKYKVTEHSVSSLVWEAIKDEASSPIYGQVLIKPDFNKEKVFLAGLSKDVTKVEKTFRDLIANTTSQVERKNNSLKTTLALPPSLYEIMCRNGLKNIILKDSPDLKIDYDVFAKNVSLHGLREEVLSAKCEILNMKQKFKSKSLNLNPQIIEFLEMNDSEEMSCLLLISHNINAMFEIDGKTIILIGFSMKDLSEAEEQLNHELICKHITVEDKKVIQSTEWKSLIAYVNETFNCKKCIALIKEVKDQVVIIGLSSTVQDIYQQLYDFVQKNTTIQKDILVKSMAVIQFLMEEKKHLQEEIKRNNVKIVTKQKFLSLCGPRLYVQDATTIIEKALSSLYSESLHINKPGAKKFCLNNEDIYVTSAKSKFNCVLYIQKIGEDDFTPGHVNLGEPHCQINLQAGVTIAVYKDDLTRHCVDVVINAANEDLNHVGGLALALSKVAGPKLQTDCNDIITRKGRLSTGDSVITDAGNLPCKHVIHTVGPRWDFSSPKKCERELQKAIRRSLEIATENGHNSIGIPAVSSGIFGFPLQLCVKNIVESIREYLKTQQEGCSLKRINLVDNDIRTIQAFTEALTSEFGDQAIKSKTRPIDSLKSEEMKKPRVSAERGNTEMMKTSEGLIIKLVQCNIQDAKTDVIVNSVGNDLNLDTGGACKALFDSAGQRLQYLLEAESQGTIVNEGSVFKTDGCNLNCDKVLHVVTPRWDRGAGSSEKKLRNIIATCLKMTEQLQLNSISFPAIGTGNLNFPKTLVATILFDEVLHFSRKGNPQNLHEINFVCHPSDRETMKAFSNEMADLQGAKSSDARSHRAPSGNHSTFLGSVMTTALGVHEMKLGSVTYQVKTGDITKENTDVIVNSSNENFTLQAGVSKSILEAAGPSVVNECAISGAQSHKGYIFTQSGNLACNHILHVVGKTDPAQIKTTVLNALLALEKQKMTSVAFPAIGTGVGRVPATDVADAMIDAVVDFASSKSAQSLQTVKVIIFQQQMLNDFYMSMKKKEGMELSGPESLLSKLTSVFLPSKKRRTQKLSAFQLIDNIEPAILHICGETRESVKMTLLWLQKVILEEQTENLFEDELLAELEEEELQILRRLQQKFQVSIEYKSQDSSVLISGLTRDVMNVYQEIQGMIKKKRDKISLERDAELFSNLVEWKYHDGSKFVSFDKFANLKLEKASDDKEKIVDIFIKGNKYTVLLEKKYFKDNHGNTMTIERVPKNVGNSLTLPPQWDPMNEQVKVVVLKTGSSEYTDVQSQFTRTCNKKILQIERIQNQTLWQNYQIKKKSMDDKNVNMNNEKQLFHGTDPDTVKNVNRNGFNRSFAGRNAAAIGNGTYFAVNANYSAQDTYSRPDANGSKYMYLARVLTGMSCAGKAGLVTPPAKNATDPTDLYDSVTDNPSGPSMYVIFSDIQAYPEYLITFSR
ncbi:protein mono-ADP-ribosyltransferase PARP14-like [Discoglossus pictus]